MDALAIRKIINITGGRSLLEVKPAKKIPEHLIYFDQKKDTYFLFEKSNGQVLGKMCARPEAIYDSTFYPSYKPYTSLYISSLWVHPEHRNKGIGKSLVNLAKRESFRRGGDGRVHLIAQKKPDSEPPHIFYRKQGFTSQYSGQIFTIDQCILDNENIPSFMRWLSMPMYLPLKNFCENCKRYLTR